MAIRQLTLGSLFNGIGGWIIAAERNGVKTIWESEVNAFCEALMKVRFPDVIQLGDVTKIDATKIPTVDIICAGSPCQDLSVAGKREGLKGERSGLFRTAIDIVRRMRLSTGGGQPRFFIWENVPGAFSSNKGLDFKAVLEEISQTEIPMPANDKWAEAGMVECLKCDIAWRVLDAQYFGVPQRRKRIFLVADFAAAGRRAGEVLFERKSLYGDSEQGSETWQATARDAEGGAGDAIYDMTHANDVIRESKGKVPTLNARMGTGGNQVQIVLNDQGGSVMNVEKETVGTLRAEAHGNNPVVAYCIAGNTIDRQTQNGGNGKGVQEELSYTLNTMDRHAVVSTTGGQIAWSSSKGSFHTNFQKDKAPTLMETDWKDPPTVVTVTADKLLEACALMMDEDSTDRI